MQARPLGLGAGSGDWLYHTLCSPTGMSLILNQSQEKRISAAKHCSDSAGPMVDHSCKLTSSIHFYRDTNVTSERMLTGESGFTSLVLLF